MVFGNLVGHCVYKICDLFHWRN